MISKKTYVNLRLDEKLFDDIAKISIEKFAENTSEAIRHLCRLGIKVEELKPHEMDKEKLDKITMELNQKIKDESFFEWIKSKTADQKSAIKNMITLEQDEQIKKESNLY